MSTIDFSALTLNPEEARDSSDLVFKKAFVNPELEQVHDVRTGVEMDKFIPIMGRYGLFGKAHPGSCNNNDVTDTIPTSEKQWSPKLISDRIIHCQDNVPDLLKFWKKSRIAANTWKDVDDEMVAFIQDTAGNAVSQSIIRHADFGDTNASPVGDATGDQKLTAGTDKAYFNVIDGMWAQIFADQAGSAEGYRYAITENGGVDKTAQDNLASDRALLAFRAMYNNISPEAFEGSQLVYQVTRSLFNNWQDYLEDQSLSFMLTRAEEGSNKWSYRGVPIVIRADWDRIIRTYYDLGTTFYLPHRAVLADLNIIPVGTSDTESMSTFKSHFDETTEKWYMKSAYKLDMKILLEEEIASAY